MSTEPHLRFISDPFLSTYTQRLLLRKSLWKEGSNNKAAESPTDRIQGLFD